MRSSNLMVMLFTVSVLVFNAGCEESAKKDTQSAFMKPAKVAETKESSTKSDSTGGTIRFESVIHDFGEIGPVSKNSCEFKFKNVGKGTLVVDQKIKSTCGCTVPQLDKSEYAPGESGVVHVTYRAGSYDGNVTKKLYVTSNDEENPKVQLTIKAKIVKRVTYEPTRLQLLLEDENANCPDIVLKSQDGKKFSIKDIKSTADCITFDFDPELKSSEFVLKPKIDMDKLQRSLHGTVKINLTHPDCSNVIIPFVALAKITVNPPSINLLNTKAGVPVEREVWVINNYNEDFEVVSVVSEKSIIKVLEQQKLGKRYQFKLEITPPEQTEGEKIFTDEFVVKLNDGEELKIPCRGFYERK